MKALIIDDEPMPGKHLEGMVKQHCFEIDEVHFIDSPLVALEHVKENIYDIIFLDVEMPRINGFEFLEKAALPAQTQIIFTTAYSQYAIEAFKANAAHYILKLVSKEDLIQAVRKAHYLIKKQDTADKAISVFIGDEHLILRQEEIHRLEASGSYTKIHTENKVLLSAKGIGTYVDKVSKTKFIRCHNSHIINIDYVTRISKGKKGYVVMKNEDAVPMVSSKRDIIIRMLGL